MQRKRYGQLQRLLKRRGRRHRLSYEAHHFVLRVAVSQCEVLLCNTTYHFARRFVIYFWGTLPSSTRCLFAVRSATVYHEIQFCTTKCCLPRRRSATTYYHDILHFLRRTTLYYEALRCITAS